MTTSTEKDHVVELQELPVTVNVTKLARGVFDLFTEDEKTVLRFGMLPAKKMELLETQLRDKFNGLGKHPREVWPKSTSGGESYTEDTRMSSVDGTYTEWHLDKLVSEAMHEVTLGIYRIGDLVV